MTQYAEQTVEVKPGSVNLAFLRKFYFESNAIALDPLSWEQIAASAETVVSIVEKGDAAYGINTGFGLLAQTRIADDQLADLQRNLVLSHAAGVGRPMPDRIVRLILLLKIVSLARGLSGVRPSLVETLIAMLNADLLPEIPEKGSVGASGDLAPLAHMALACMGTGFFHVNGERVEAGSALSSAGIEPLVLGPKERLALLNGTHASTAFALSGLFETENVFTAAVVAGAMSVDALKGSISPFDPRVHLARGHMAQIDVAAKYLQLVDGSKILKSHIDCSRVQDPYSLRCQPQVMGAGLSVIRAAAEILETEANAATDNPLIFAETGDVISAGNFHAEPVAFAADMLALPLVEVPAMSERRVAILVDPKMSGLPAFLVKDSGLNSGFMIAQVTAAALVSENKALAHPASVDSIPTSANQEDHVSMATYAARRLTDMAENAADVIAVELLAAVQGQDFHAPLKTSPVLWQAHQLIRDTVPFYDADRYFSPEIKAVSKLVRQGAFMKWAGSLVPSRS